MSAEMEIHNNKLSISECWHYPKTCFAQTNNMKLIKLTCFRSCNYLSGQICAVIVYLYVVLDFIANEQNK